MSKINVLLVDDHNLFRNGLKLLLNNYKNINIVGEASNGKEFAEHNSLSQTNIALVDIDMPIMDGIEATKLVMAKFPDIKIIALSMFGDYDYYSKMISAGAKGFILKNSDITEVLNAIESVHKGGTYFTEEILIGLVKNYNTKQPLSKEIEVSEREIDVLKLICKGLSNNEIAEELSISKRTVDKHRSNLLSKTNSKNTASLVIYAIKNSLVNY